MGKTVRLLILALCPLLLFGSAFTQGKKRLDPIYDKEKDATTYFLSPMLLVKNDVFPTSGINLRDGAGERQISGETLMMVTYVRSQGKSSATPKEVVIALESYHYQKFQYGTDRDLKVTTPKREYPLGKMNLSGRRSGGDVIGYFETLELAIPVSTYREIIDSEKIEATVGATSFRLTVDQIKSLQVIAEQYLK